MDISKLSNDEIIDIIDKKLESVFKDKYDLFFGLMNHCRILLCGESIINILLSDSTYGLIFYAPAVYNDKEYEEACELYQKAFHMNIPTDYELNGHLIPTHGSTNPKMICAIVKKKRIFDYYIDSQPISVCKNFYYVEDGMRKLHIPFWSDMIKKTFTLIPPKVGGIVRKSTLYRLSHLNFKLNMKDICFDNIHFSKCYSKDYEFLVNRYSENEIVKKDIGEIIAKHDLSKKFKCLRIDVRCNNCNIDGFCRIDGYGENIIMGVISIMNGNKFKEQVQIYINDNEAYCLKCIEKYGYSLLK